MKIIPLVENTSIRADLKPVHGLSLYIETRGRNLLFDLGPDDTFLQNASLLGIDLSRIDMVVISHGHFDHGGGLRDFLEINNKAKIYIRREAFEPHFAKVGDGNKTIGLDTGLAVNERIVFTGDTMKVDDELFVFSGVDELWETQSSRALLKGTPDGYAQDDFTHEQNLIVTEGDKSVLFSGCSHSGILGIMRAAACHQQGIAMVFGGFHLFNPDTGATEAMETVRGLAEKLSEYNAVYYTCHCTGVEAYESMRGIMGEKLKYISIGSVVEL